MFYIYILLTIYTITIKHYSLYIIFFILYFHFKDPIWAPLYGGSGHHVLEVLSDAPGSAQPCTQFSAKTEQKTQSIHLPAGEAAKKAFSF